MRISRNTWIGFAVLGLTGWLSSIGVGTGRLYQMALVLSVLMLSARAMVELSRTPVRRS